MGNGFTHRSVWQITPVSKNALAGGRLMLIDCDECGNKVSDRAKACPQCGTPVTPPPMLVDCDECGNKVSSQANRCPECGAPIAGSPAKEVERQPPVVSQPSSVPPLGADLSSLEFRQSKAERTKPSSRIGTVIFLLVAVGVVMFKYVILPDVRSGGGQERKGTSISRGGAKQTAAGRANNAPVQSSAGSLDINQFVSCWNKSTGRLDQPSPIGDRSFSSSSSGFSALQTNDGVSRDVFVSYRGKDVNMFVDGATVAVHCTSCLSVNDSNRLVMQLISTMRYGGSTMEFEGKTYYMSDLGLTINISEKR